jgi:hypothetical protein
MCWRVPTPACIRGAGDSARDAQQRMQQTAALLYARFARFGFMRLQLMLNVKHRFQPAACDAARAARNAR